LRHHTQPNDIQPNEILPNDIQPNEIQPNEIQPNEILPNDIQPNNTQHCDIENNDTHKKRLFCRVAIKVIQPNVVLLSVVAPTNFTSNFLSDYHRSQKSKIDCLRFDMCPLLAPAFQG
jgi:hypothetical protein